MKNSTTKMIISALMLFLCGCSAQNDVNATVSDTQSSSVYTEPGDEVSTSVTETESKITVPETQSINQPASYERIWGEYTDEDVKAAKKAIEDYCDTVDYFSVVSLEYSDDENKYYSDMFLESETSNVIYYIKENRLIFIKGTVYYTGTDGSMTANTNQTFIWSVCKKDDGQWEVLDYGY